MRLALMASLTLNVLIIGAVAGTLLVSRSAKGHPRHSNLLGFAHNLPRERSDMIRQKVADAQANLESTRKGIRDARASVRSALDAQPFDQATLSAALEGIVQAWANEKRAKVTLFAETVSQLTPEERHQLHDWLEKRRKAF